MIKQKIITFNVLDLDSRYDKNLNKEIETLNAEGWVAKDIKPICENDGRITRYYYVILFEKSEK